MAQKIIRACRGYPTVDLYEKPTKAKLLLVSEIPFLRTKNSAIKSSDILKCQKNNTYWVCDGGLDMKGFIFQQPE